MPLHRHFGSGSPDAQVVGWLSGYQETLKELGLEDSEIVFPEGPDRGMTLLVGKYISRMRGTLHTWFINILQVRLPQQLNLTPGILLPHQIPV